MNSMNKLEVGIPRTKQELDFNIPEMSAALEKAYLQDRRVDSKPWKRKTYPPSGVGYGSGKCPRRWHYEFTGTYVRVDDMTVLGQANMSYGIDAHERIQGLFEKADILIEKERELKLDSPAIRGFVDLIVNWNGEPHVGEIKTTKQEAFTLLKASGKPHGYQLIQLLIYMKGLGIDKGFFLYENKNTGEMLIMPVEMDEENQRIIDNAFQWFIDVKALEHLPKRPYKKSSKECTYCPFKKACWEDIEGFIDVEPLEVPE